MEQVCVRWIRNFLFCTPTQICSVRVIIATVGRAKRENRTIGHETAIFYIVGILNEKLTSEIFLLVFTLLAPIQSDDNEKSATSTPCCCLWL